METVFAGAEAQINNPYGLVIGPDGALYFFRSIGNYRVRRLDLKTKLISTVAGSGQKGYSGDGGPALAAHRSTSRTKSASTVMATCTSARCRITSCGAWMPTHGSSPRWPAQASRAPRAMADRRPSALLRQPHSIAFDAAGPGC